MNFSLQKQPQTLTPPLFLYGGSFTAKRRAVTYCFPRLISSLFSCVPWEALQHGPFQQLLPNNKNIVLFYFIFPSLHLSEAITLPYSAYDLGAMGGRTHWLWMIISFHRAEIYKLHFSGGGFVAIWFCCSAAEWRRVVLSVWPIGNSFK